MNEFVYKLTKIGVKHPVRNMLATVINCAPDVRLADGEHATTSYATTTIC